MFTSFPMTFNPLKTNGNYIYRRLLQSVTLLLCVWISYDSQCKQLLRISLNSVNQLIFLTVKCVIFEVRTEFFLE
jgi:hypothetical protein